MKVEYLILLIHEGPQLLYVVIALVGCVRLIFRAAYRLNANEAPEGLQHGCIQRDFVAFQQRKAVSPAAARLGKFVLCGDLWFGGLCRWDGYSDNDLTLGFFHA